MKRIFSRKLIAFILGLAACTLLAFYDKLSDTYMYTIMGLSALYTGGKMGSKVTKAISSATNAKHKLASITETVCDEKSLQDELGKVVEDA